MRKIVEGFFTRNLGWKIFSIVTAIVLWGVVINITNPIEVRTFTPIVEFENEDSLTKQNLVISNINKLNNFTVTIKVEGTKMDLDELYKNWNNKIKATVDLKSAYYGTTVDDPNHVPINVNLPEGFKLVDKNPSYLEIIFENVETVEREIRTETQGEPKSNFVVLQPSVEPKTVKVKGASSIIAKLDCVKVYVDVNNIDQNIIQNVELKAYDTSGNVLSGLELLDANDIPINEVAVNINVNEYKKIPIDCSANFGMPADGFTLVGIECEPKYAEIIGTTESIKNITKIQLEPIDITDLNTTKTITYSLRDYITDKDVEIRNGTPNQVNVTIKIAKEETKDFTIPINNITVTGNSTHQYTFNQQDIVLSLKAISSVIDSINISDIKCSIDLSGYGEGNYDVPINITLPSRVTLAANAPSINVTINNTQNDEATTSSEETTLPSTQESTTNEETSPQVTDAFSNNTSEPSTESTEVE